MARLPILLVVCVLATCLQGCSTIMGMFTAPEATAQAIGTAGAESLTGAPVGQVVGAGESLASVQNAQEQNPDNAAALDDLQEHFTQEVEQEARQQHQPHVRSGDYDRRRRPERDRALVSVYDRDGNLLSVRTLEEGRPIKMPSKPPTAYEWQSWSRSSWRFGQPRGHLIERQTLLGDPSRLRPRLHGDPRPIHEQTIGSPVTGSDAQDR
ncbi:MAG: hypothetical protein ACOCXJ_02295 [Planctomycetota bacterium]